MIDNVCLKIPCKGNEGIIERLENYWWRDQNTHSGNMQNMGIFITYDNVIIRGSLAKFLNGENVSTLKFGQVEKAIQKLENETGINIEKGIVRMVECGISVVTNNQPSEYLKLFGYPPRFTRHEYATITGVETVTYSTQTGSYQFTGYDKVQEVQHKKK